jgi:hypothetical protein
VEVDPLWAKLETGNRMRFMRNEEADKSRIELEEALRFVTSMSCKQKKTVR